MSAQGYFTETMEDHPAMHTSGCLNRAEVKELADYLFRKIPVTRWAKGSGEQWREYLRCLLSDLRRRGIRFQRTRDNRAEYADMQGEITRERTYYLFDAENWHRGELYITTRWRNGRLTITKTRITMPIRLGGTT